MLEENNLAQVPKDQQVATCFDFLSESLRNGLHYMGKEED
jgi:hypothetical protein